MNQDVNLCLYIADRLQAFADGRGAMGISEFRDAAAAIERLTHAVSIAGKEIDAHTEEIKRLRMTLAAAQAALKEQGDEMVGLRAGRVE